MQSHKRFFVDSIRESAHIELGSHIHSTDRGRTYARGFGVSFNAMCVGNDNRKLKRRHRSNPRRATIKRKSIYSVLNMYCGYYTTNIKILCTAELLYCLKNTQNILQQTMMFLSVKRSTHITPLYSRLRFVYLYTLKCGFVE